MDAINNVTEGDLSKTLIVKSGIVLTISHDTYNGFEPRLGAENDLRAIKQSFEKINFQVLEPHQNYTTEQVFNTLEAASIANYETNDCFVLFILTQFDEIGKFLSKDGVYSEDDVIEFFKGNKCKSLITKPKIFIFQASKATSSLSARNSMETDGSPFKPNLFTLPVEADILIFRSSYEIGPLHIPSQNGSWFIQHLCEYFENLDGKVDLFDAMTSILNYVKEDKFKSIEKNSSTKSPIIANNVLPDITSTLTKFVYLMRNQRIDKNLHNTLVYNIKTLTTGKLIVFNYSYVFNPTKREFSKRDGTEWDKKSILECFKKVNFEVIIHDNLPKDRVIEALRKDNDFSKYSCVAVAFLTHGIEGKLGTYDSPLSEEDLFKELSSKKREDLKDRPKIFFLQVCRGDKATRALPILTNADVQIPVERRVSVSRDAGVMAVEDFSKSSPPLEEDDILVVHSTYAGTASHRHSETGTWFIQEMCKTLKDLTHNEEVSLLDVILTVQRNVAIGKEHEDQTVGLIKKQMPVFISTLTKRLMLGPFENK